MTLMPWNCSYLSKPWGYLIKYFIPSLLLILLMDKMKKDTYRDERGEPWKSQMEGWVPFIFMILIVVVVAIFPCLMEQKIDDADEEDRERLWRDKEVGVLRNASDFGKGSDP